MPNMLEHLTLSDIKTMIGVDGEYSIRPEHVHIVTKDEIFHYKAIFEPHGIAFTLISARPKLTH